MCFKGKTKGNPSFADALRVVSLRTLFLLMLITGVYVEYEVSLNTQPDIIGAVSPMSVTLDQCRELCTNSGTSCSSFTYDTNNNRCWRWLPSQNLVPVTSQGFNHYTKHTSYPDGKKVTCFCFILDYHSCHAIISHEQTV